MLGRRFTSSRIRKERRRRLITKIALGVLFAASLLFLLIELVDLKQLRVERVRFEGNQAVSKEGLWEIVRSYVEGDYARVFSKKNILVVPRGKIERALLTRFIRLEDVTIYREGLHTLVVRSTEREPAALWCLPAGLPADLLAEAFAQAGASAKAGASAQADGEGVSTSACYYLDENGLAFAVAPRLSGGTFLLYAKTFPEKVIGELITSTEHFRSLRSFMDALAGLGFRTESVTWRKDAINLVVQGVRDDGSAARLTLKIPFSHPYDQALSNLTSILQTPDTDAEPLSLEGIDYIDLRFENKVFYKKDASE